MLNDLIEKRVKDILSRQEERKKANPNGNYYEYTEETIKAEIEDSISRVPERYKDAEVDEAMHTKIKKAVDDRKGCYFYGGAGTGKTHLLYGLYKTFRVSGYRCEVWNVPDQLAYLRMKYGEKGEGEQGIEDELKTEAILLIDDFGAEKQTEWNTEIMYRLINFRYENMLRTFFASNLSIQQLAERSGDRLASRIVEMCEVVEMSGEDKRLKK